MRNKMKRWCREFIRSRIKEEGIALNGSEMGIDLVINIRTKIKNDDSFDVKRIKHREFREVLVKGWESLVTNIKKNSHI